LTAKRKDDGIIVDVITVTHTLGDWQAPGGKPFKALKYRYYFGYPSTAQTAFDLGIGLISINSISP
jgi:hypothetical protein